MVSDRLQQLLVYQILAILIEKATFSPARCRFELVDTCPSSFIIMVKKQRKYWSQFSERGKLILALKIQNIVKVRALYKVEVRSD